MGLKLSHRSRLKSIIMRRQRVSEVTEPINRPGSPRHRINPGKKKIQAILSKAKGPKNKTGKRLVGNRVLKRRSFCKKCYRPIIEHTRVPKSFGQKMRLIEVIEG